MPTARNGVAVRLETDDTLVLGHVTESGQESQRLVRAEILGRRLQDLTHRVDEMCREV